ncbi:MAG: sulfate transporter CysZ [Ruminobacter sp.]|nr:sulfate transporter CysZ [Ruminobacter sp.]
MNTRLNQNSFFGGIKYFLKGFSLSTGRGMKRYTLLPIVINVLLMLVGYYFSIRWSINYTGELINCFTPDWLHWTRFIIYPFIFIAVIIVSVLLFTTITLIIGAPFYSILAEKSESILLNKPVPNVPLSRTLKETPAMIWREIAKLIYRIPIMLLNLVMLFVPVIGEAVIVITGGWCYALDFTSYGFENNHIQLKKTYPALKKYRKTCLSFGICVWASLLIPFLNLFMIPAAVCGGTALWVDILRPDFEDDIRKYEAELEERA